MEQSHGIRVGLSPKQEFKQEAAQGLALLLEGPLSIS